MIINTASIIFFSPTGTTKKIANSILKGMDLPSSQVIDLTSPEVRNSPASEITSDIVLLGVPVYATKVPYILNDFLSKLKGEGKPIVLIAVYGSMSDGIALNELIRIACNSCFKVAAAASFIGEHSFSTDNTPIAKGRPDKNDLNIAEEFGRNVIKKLQKIDSLSDITLKIPEGKVPLIAKILPENSAKIFAKAPMVDITKCSRCGICVRLCPMGAIDKSTLAIDKDKCLRCFCCAKICPKKARKITYSPKVLVSKVLSLKAKARKEPKMYLP